MRDPWLVAMVVGLVLACLIFAVVWWHIFAGRAQTHRPNARVAEEEAPVVMEAGDGATNN
jgi:hypothetical protein